MILKMPKGSIVEVFVEYDTGWDAVRYEGKTGFCSTEFLTPLASCDEPPKEDATDDSVAFSVMIPCESKEQAEAILKLIPTAFLVGSGAND